MIRAKFLKIFCASVVFCLCLTGRAFSVTPSWEFVGWDGGGCYPNLTFDPHIRDRVYLTSDVAGIYRSDDKGEHWYFVNQGLGSLLVAQVVVAPSDSSFVYAATKGGVYVSKDQAKTWTKADSAQGWISFKRPDSYHPIAVDGKNPAHLCVGTGKGQLFCSHDFGTKWTEVTSAKSLLAAGQPVTVVRLDNQGRIYASSIKGIIRCNSEKANCELLEGPKHVSDFKISYKNPGTIYAVGDPWSWTSVDDGKTWQKSQALTQGGKIYRIAVDESLTTPLLYAARNRDWNGEVIISRDHGKSWTGLRTVMNADVVDDPTRVWAQKDGRLTSLVIDPFNPQVLFRTDWWGVWRSDDGGRTWNEKIKGAPNTVGTQITVTPNKSLLVSSMDNGLLKSTDDGQTYKAIFPTKYDPARNGHVWRVAMAGKTIIATSSPWNQPNVNQVILSQDGGQSFELVRAGLPSYRPKKNTMWGEGYPRALAVDPTNPDNVYLGIDGDDGGGLFISRDRGKTWHRSAGQPGSLRIYNGLAIDPTNPKRIVWGANGTNGGVYISSNGGENFNHVFKGMSWVFDLKVSSDGTIFVAGDSGGAKLFVSRDQGRTWKMAGDFGQGRALASVAVDPANPKRVAVATTSWTNAAPNKIFLSQDGGVKFTDITEGLPDGAGASNMTFDPKSNSLYITRYAGSAYRLKF